MDPANLKYLNAEKNQRRAALLVTELDGGRDRLIREGDIVAGELGSLVAKAFLTGKSGIAMIGDAEYFLNVHVPPPRIVVIGAVHISQALAPIAVLAGYDIEVIDPRTAFATPQRFAGVNLSARWPQEALADKPLDAFTAVAAVTHDPKIDDWALCEALRKNCFYVGALGSRKTHAKRCERLASEGLSPAQISTIRAPIGIDISASSPQEIAVAIMAEIIGAFRSRGKPAPGTEAGR